MKESVHIVCPRCDAVNRVPGNRLVDEPTCGKCGSRLFQARPLALTEQRFSRHLERNEIPLLVDFWADWCGPCHMMAPAFEQAAARLEPRVRLAKVDTEEARDLGARLGIRSIPTLILFKNGRETARQSGAMDAGSLVAWASRYL